MLGQGCGRDASPDWVRRQFLADNRANKLNGNTVTITNRCKLLMKLLGVPDTNMLIVNIELTKIKITVLINLKGHNRDYPCYLVGRPHITFPLTTKCNIP